MSYSIPTEMPSVINAGDTLKYTISLPDYLPADSWVLSYALVKDGVQIAYTASDNGDGTHLINVDEATTLNYEEGVYNYQARVTDGTDVHTVDIGTVEVKPSFSAMSGGYDARSPVKRTLDALEATLEGKATNDQLSYSIANRSISKMSMTEVLEAYDYYKRAYQKELDEIKISKGLGTGKKIFARFNN